MHYYQHAAWQGLPTYQDVIGAIQAHSLNGRPACAVIDLTEDKLGWKLSTAG